MQYILKPPFGPLHILLFVGLLLSDLAVAKEYSLADVDKAVFSEDVSSLEKIYRSSEGRLKRVAGYRWLISKIFVEGDIEGSKAELELYVANLEKELQRQRKDAEGWGLVDTYAWRGQAHEALGSKVKAKADFKQALTLQSQSTWLQSLLSGLSHQQAPE